ncbi:hypothetical protein SAMN05216490_4023 [Mucilaginibacter mallensis]|uniref:Uncharacterized protein n=1 Tax=Mucilaginibacter mallensis TaxID=652787 RepID=A0A1H2BBH8_MUCMA|nr:hypothetical protein [Mucilaginibacter sp. X5P1]SDT55581.1 hypothetical protein SAMN05216490_4023 [Mucilaginibacter mallensis]
MYLIETFNSTIVFFNYAYWYSFKVNYLHKMLSV